MIKNKGGPLWGQARGDPSGMFKARGDPNLGRWKRSRAPTGYALSLSFNRLILPEWERYARRRDGEKGRWGDERR